MAAACPPHSGRQEGAGEALCGPRVAVLAKTERQLASSTRPHPRGESSGFRLWPEHEGFMFLTKIFLNDKPHFLTDFFPPSFLRNGKIWENSKSICSEGTPGSCTVVGGEGWES